MVLVVLLGVKLVVVFVLVVKVGRNVVVAVGVVVLVDVDTGPI